MLELALRKVEKAEFVLKNQKKREAGFKFNPNKPKFTCSIFVPGNSLFIGTSLGSTFGYGDQLNVELGGHMGPVECLCFIPGFGSNGLLVSGSVGGEMRIYDPWKREHSTSSCIQSIRDHGGLVSYIGYSKGTLLTCSTDMTLRVWKPASGREFMEYPWFSCVQVIRDSSFTTSAVIRISEVPFLYIGNSSGDIHVFKGSNNNVSTINNGMRSARLLSGTSGGGFMNIGLMTNNSEVGVSKTILINEINYLCVLYVDHFIRCLDSITGAQHLEIRNCRRKHYVDFAYNVDRSIAGSSTFELITIDTAGTLEIWNLLDGSLILTHEILVEGRTISPKSLNFAPSIRDLPHISGSAAIKEEGGPKDTIIILCEQFVVFVAVCRDVVYTEVDGHEDAVLVMEVMTATLSSSPSEDSDSPPDLQEVLVSASLDSTIRSWDLFDLHPLFTFKQHVSEISALTLDSKQNILMFGCQNGNVHFLHYDSSMMLLESHFTEAVTDMCVSVENDRTWLMASSADGTIAIWDISQRPQANGFKPILSTDIVVFADRPEDIEVKDVDGLDTGLQCMLSLMEVPDDTVSCIAATVRSDSQHAFFAGGGNRQVKSYVFGSNRSRSTIKLTTTQGSPVKLLCDGNFLLCGTDNGYVVVWDFTNISSPHLMGQFQPHPCRIRDMLFMADLGLFATCAFDGMAKLWKYESFSSSNQEEIGEIIHEIKHHEEFTCVAYDNIQNKLLLGSNQHHITAFPLPDELLLEKKIIEPLTSTSVY